LVPNALQPAEVDEVILCQMLGRGIVLVGEDQLSLAIGRRGQNVRLASKLCGWDIEIMTREDLDQQIERAVDGFSSIEGLEESVAERLVGEGFLSYDDLSVIEPDDLMEMGELSAEAVDAIVNEAENRATVAEEAAANERRKQREQEHVEEVPGEVEVGDAEEETPPAGEEVQEQEQEATSLDEPLDADVHQRTQVRHQHLRSQVHDVSGIFTVLASFSLPATGYKKRSE
jgi:N utilization substance protein A